MSIRRLVFAAGLILTSACGNSVPVVRDARGQELNCTYPVMAHDTARSLLTRFGDHARIDTLIGVEGDEIPGLVLWGNEPAKTMEVGFTDEARSELEFVRVIGSSDWAIAGLRVGDGLERVELVNGRPFSFYGFGWDYGGNVHDFHGGRLAMFDGCLPFMAVDFDDDAVEIPNDLIGERSVSSEHPMARKLAIRIREMGLFFAD